MIFVDTGAWFALSVESDPDHKAAKEFVTNNREPLLTSDYVIDELLTLFVVRRSKNRGVDWLRDVLSSGSFEVVHVDTDCFQEACEIYQKYTDKVWSFTDCTSYVLIRRLKIAAAFSFDDHFRQFGTLAVVP
jgi:uncharacterized protein